MCARLSSGVEPHGVVARSPRTTAGGNRKNGRQPKARGSIARDGIGQWTFASRPCRARGGHLPHCYFQMKDLIWNETPSASALAWRERLFLSHSFVAHFRQPSGTATAWTDDRGKSSYAQSLREDRSDVREKSEVYIVHWKTAEVEESPQLRHFRKVLAT